jgi:hypothetical protein
MGEKMTGTTGNHLSKETVDKIVYAKLMRNLQNPTQKKRQVQTMTPQEMRRSRSKVIAEKVEAMVKNKPYGTEFNTAEVAASLGRVKGKFVIRSRVRQVFKERHDMVYKNGVYVKVEIART